MKHFVEVKEMTAKARPARARAKKARVEKVAKATREAKGNSSGKRTSKGTGDPLKQRFVSNPVSTVW